jgi:sphingosine kinase
MRKDAHPADAAKGNLGKVKARPGRNLLIISIILCISQTLLSHVIALHSLSAMASTTVPTEPNPFDDPTGSDHAAAHLQSVLTVDRNATLTLGTDALIVLDEGLVHRREPRNCCGLLPRSTKTTRAIPFYNVLWATLDDFEITVQYAQPTGKKGCTVGYVHYTMTDKSMHAHAKAWVEALLGRSYPGGVKRRKRVKVLVNPFGGQGYAQKLWTREVEPIFAAAKCEVDVEKTAYRGHAIEIAEKIDVDAFDVIACASGDGLPHEVFNGLAKQKDAKRALRKVAVVQLPCGTGNAMSLNLTGTDSPSLAAVAIVKGVRSPLDLVAITQGDQKYYSFLSQAVGIIAESDLGTETLRWMGPLRFTWGFLVRLMGQTVYPAEVSYAMETDDKRAIQETHHRFLKEHVALTAKKASQGEETDSEISVPAPTSPETETETMPALRYGTITDPLPSSFQTHDLPTLGNFYTGNMAYMSPDTPFFPVALPADGFMDLITIDGLVPRLTAVRMLTNVEHGTLMNFSEVNYRKITGYRITPRLAPGNQGKGLKAKIGRWLGGAGKEKQGFIAIDGERVPFEPFQAEVMPSLGTVLSKRGAVYEFDGPPVV